MSKVYCPKVYLLTVFYNTTSHVKFSTLILTNFRLLEKLESLHFWKFRMIHFLLIFKHCAKLARSFLWLDNVSIFPRLSPKWFCSIIHIISSCVHLRSFRLELLKVFINWLVYWTWSWSLYHWKALPINKIWPIEKIMNDLSSSSNGNATAHHCV